MIQPALAVAAGIEQLTALCEAHLDYVGRRVWPGGCFFSLIASEVGGRSGAVHDRVAGEHRQWVELLADNVRRAIAVDELTAELSTMLTGADIAYLLHEDPSILDRVRVGIRARVEHWSGHDANV